MSLGSVASFLTRIATGHAGPPIQCGNWSRLRHSLMRRPQHADLMRREQHIHAVEQLDAGAYGYLVSRTALLHPQGETFDVSMGLGGLFEALTKIAAQPDKDFGEMVRQRRRRRGLPIAPAGKVLPFLPARGQDDLDERAAIDSAAERKLEGSIQGHDTHAARVRLAERRLHEALAALEHASLRAESGREMARLEKLFAAAVAHYELLSRHVPTF